MKPIEQIAQAIAEHGRPNWIAYVPQNILHQVDYNELFPLLQNAKWSTDALTKASQYQAIIDWCSNNLYAEVSVDYLATMSGLSPVSVRKFIRENPLLLRKIGRGLWEVCDPEGEQQ